MLSMLEDHWTNLSEVQLQLWIQALAQMRRQAPVQTKVLIKFLCDICNNLRFESWCIHGSGTVWITKLYTTASSFPQASPGTISFSLLCTTRSWWSCCCKWRESDQIEDGEIRFKTSSVRSTYHCKWKDAFWCKRKTDSRIHMCTRDATDCINHKHHRYTSSNGQTHQSQISIDLCVHNRRPTRHEDYQKHCHELRSSLQSATSFGRKSVSQSLQKKVTTVVDCVTSMICRSLQYCLCEEEEEEEEGEEGS